MRHPEIERMDVGGEVEPMEELVAAAGGAAELEGAEKR